MFGAGWTEMLVIGVVALIVIGPKDLPVVMQRIGKMVGAVRRMGTEFQREINKTTGLDQITDLRRSITEPLRQTSEEIAREFNTITSKGVEPSGVMKPLDPKVESVYETINAASAAPAAIAPTEAATSKPPKSRASKKPAPATPAAAAMAPAVKRSVKAKPAIATVPPAAAKPKAAKKPAMPVIAAAPPLPAAKAMPAKTAAKPVAKALAAKAPAVKAPAAEAGTVKPRAKKA